MNLNVSERLICSLRDLARSTDRVTDLKNKTVRERRESEHGDDGALPCCLGLAIEHLDLLDETHSATILRQEEDEPVS
jgi:hypothetical protein